MIIKLIIIIIFIFVFYLAIFYVMEKFTDNYRNINEYPQDYNKSLRSSLPYDIIIKNEFTNTYDYGNDELNTKFIKVFDITYQKEIKYIEGVQWSPWNNNTSYPYIPIIREFITIVNTSHEFRLKNFDDNFEIVRHMLKRFKMSMTGEKYLLDIEVVIYRRHRPTARHIKIICVSSQASPNEYLMVKVIGVISQKDIFEYDNKYKYKSYETIQKPHFQYSSQRENEGLLYLPSIDSTIDNDIYMEYIPEKIINYNLNEFIYDPNDTLTNNAIQSNLYNKLLKDLI